MTAPLPKNPAICERHFLPEEIIVNAQRHDLVPGAIPSQCRPPTLHQEIHTHEDCTTEPANGELVENYVSFLDFLAIVQEETQAPWVVVENEMMLHVCQIELSTVSDIPVCSQDLVICKVTQKMSLK